MLLRSAEEASVEDAGRAAERLMHAARGERSIDKQRLTENLRFYAGLKETIRQNTLDAYCVRCWPELRDRRRITPCAAHALLAEEGFPNTCEVDLTALITTWTLSRLAGAPAFNFDLTAYLEEEGTVQLAHCGAAAPSLAGDPEAVSIRAHMRTGTGATRGIPVQARSRDAGEVAPAKQRKADTGGSLRRSSLLGGGPRQRRDGQAKAVRGGAGRLADARGGGASHRAGSRFLAERSGDALRINGDPIRYAEVSGARVQPNSSSGPPCRRTILPEADATRVITHSRLWARCPSLSDLNLSSARRGAGFRAVDSYPGSPRGCRRPRDPASPAPSSASVR